MPLFIISTKSPKPWKAQAWSDDLEGDTTFENGNKVRLQKDIGCIPPLAICFHVAVRFKKRKSINDKRIQLDWCLTDRSYLKEVTVTHFTGFFFLLFDEYFCISVVRKPAVRTVSWSWRCTGWRRLWSWPSQLFSHWFFSPYLESWALNKSPLLTSKTLMFCFSAA